MDGSLRNCRLDHLRKVAPLDFFLVPSAKQIQRSMISPLFLFGSTLFVLGLVSLLTGHIVSHGEWYAQLRRPWGFKQVHLRHGAIDIWESKLSDAYRRCSERSPRFKGAVSERASNGYLLIAASGGLNQQRIGIVDAVVIARILNATLVLPALDHHSFWKDDSDFADVFDADWFISALSKDVKIVKRIPDKVMRRMERPPYTMRIPRRSPPEYYLNFVLPILLRRRAVQLTKFDYRLANDIDEELQKLRCRANYEALRFTRPIRELGEKIVQRMGEKAARFVAIHLRFEPDMLAFSGCYYGGGDRERKELGEIRKRWENLPELDAAGERRRGKCPLTPQEVGLMLRALGFGNETAVYVASGEIYRAEETLQPLRELFPHFFTKDSILAGDEAFTPLLAFSSRLAAVDYAVCFASHVFVANNNGNMAKILAGHRRYEGHRRTIRPNARKLSRAFRAREETPWAAFVGRVRAAQRGFMGEPDEMRPGRGDFHEFPYACVCANPNSTFEWR
ncbi:O-fucosyltransferase family protein [Wolffia australiana]